jgi:hypothetical protein
MTHLPASIPLALLLALLGALPLVADDTHRWRREEAKDSVDRPDTVVTDDASVSSGRRMIALQRDLNLIILGIGSARDVEVADPKIGAIFERMAAAIRASADEEVLTAAAENPEARELEEAMTRHIQELATRNPEVVMALAEVLMKHTDKVMEAATDLMKELDVSGELDEAREALEEAQRLLQSAESDLEESHEMSEEKEWFESLDIPDARPEGPAGRWKEATYAMMEELLAISASITSVEDAEGARPRIVAALEKLAVVIEEIADGDISLTAEDLKELTFLQLDMSDDLRFLDLKEREKEAEERLARVAANVAIRFEEIVGQEKRRMQPRMEEANERFRRKTEE